MLDAHSSLLGLKKHLILVRVNKRSGLEQLYGDFHSATSNQLSIQAIYAFQYVTLWERKKKELSPKFCNYIPECSDSSNR